MSVGVFSVAALYLGQRFNLHYFHRFMFHVLFVHISKTTQRFSVKFVKFGAKFGKYFLADSYVSFVLKSSKSNDKICCSSMLSSTVVFTPGSRVPQGSLRGIQRLKGE